jgi:dihydrofolate reductase
MTRIVFDTAVSIDGFIADSDNSLAWLFAVPGGEPDLDLLPARATVIVEGSTTYEWILAETDVLTDPAKWQEVSGRRVTYVFTTRRLPVPDGADVRFLRGPVADALPVIREAAGTGDVWVVGGGDLAGQFLDAGALDELAITVAPVMLGAGAPLFPRRVESDRLQLRSASVHGPFARLVYDVVAPVVPIPQPTR